MGSMHGTLLILFDPKARSSALRYHNNLDSKWVFSVRIPQAWIFSVFSGVLDTVMPSGRWHYIGAEEHTIIVKISCDD